MLSQIVSMTAALDFDDRNFLRAWREFRGWTQDELAERADTTRGMIGHLEAGRRQLTTRWLRTLGAVLQIPAGFIIDRHPDDVPQDILALWENIPDDRQALALQVLETFRKAS